MVKIGHTKQIQSDLKQVESTYIANTNERYHGKHVLNPLPKAKFLDMTELKAFADDKSNVAKMTFSLCDRVENTVGKEENTVYQHFLLFP